MTQPETPKQPTVEELGAVLSDKHRRFAEAYLTCFSQSAAGRLTGFKHRATAHTTFHRLDVQAYIQARMEDACMPANEVLARLSAYARVTGDQFTAEVEREVPVYEDRPLQEKIDYLESQVGQMLKIDPELLKGRIERTHGEIAELTVELAVDPAAMYRKQVGTRTVQEVVPSLEAARDNGVLFALESVEHGPNGLKWKRTSSTEALTLIGKHHKLFTERTEHSGSVDLGVKYIAGLSEEDL